MLFTGVFYMFASYIWFKISFTISPRPKKLFVIKVLLILISILILPFYVVQVIEHLKFMDEDYVELVKFLDPVIMLYAFTSAIYSSSCFTLWRHLKRIPTNKHLKGISLVPLFSLFTGLF